MKQSLCIAILVAFLNGCASPSESVVIPPPPREFRAAWVATVGNIDWPSRPGLTSHEQQREMTAILDRAVKLNLNAIILQVRTGCDALYPSDLEPWSAFLTGRQGEAPSPYYDPLKTWVREAHRRGLELHAWFNPFRVSLPSSIKDPPAPNHVSRTRTDLVKTYGEFQWLDPGEPAARQHSIRVILDVLKRYDVDGIHIDDYFYPYPKKGLDFPDQPSWTRYVRGGGTLSRDGWRRQNLNVFIETLYRDIKYNKPWVQFGISPFGIYRPGEPKGVRGFDQYDGLYADVKLWFHRGWCDYLSPQLYWKISSPGQPFAKLLGWWAGQNLKSRHLWPGIYTGRIIAATTRLSTRSSATAWSTPEIIDQIAVTRRQPGATGDVHFSMKTLMADRGGIDEALLEGPYALPAIVPASPWLGSMTPGRPTLRIRRAGLSVEVSWSPRWFEAQPWTWAVGLRAGGHWRWRIFPGAMKHWMLTNEATTGANPEVIAVEGLTRVGLAGPPAVRPLK